MLAIAFFPLTDSNSSLPQLPPNLTTWQNIDGQGSEENQEYVNIWNSLEAFFHEHQFTLFPRMNEYNQFSPGLPAPSNYLFGSPNHIEGLGALGNFCVPTACHHAAQKNGRHYVIRVMRVGEQGLHQLQILRLLSNTVPDNLFSNNHILPMIEELTLDDISFAVFPRVFGRLKDILRIGILTAKQSTLEDALYLIMQALEVSLLSLSIILSLISPGDHISSREKHSTSCKQKLFSCGASDLVLTIPVPGPLHRQHSP